MIITLTHRALVRFSRPDAVAFLNDLITAEVPLSHAEGVRPAALLTPQGRILFDLLISRDGDDILIELDRDRRDDFIKKMMMYRLRRDVGIDIEAMPVHAVIGTEDIAVINDTRFTHADIKTKVGRYYGTPAKDYTDNAVLWAAFRYEHGVPEGADEMMPEKAMPLEARLDLSGGISFEKGCYIGQEVTARTRYRGLVKRSYLPILLSASITVPHDITAEGKVVGEVIGIAEANDQIIGLASIRLDALQRETALDIDGHVITPLYPPRLMPLPARKDS